jgi:hypothetical protein
MFTDRGDTIVKGKFVLLADMTCYKLIYAETIKKYMYMYIQSYD